MALLGLMLVAVGWLCFGKLSKPIPPSNVDNQTTGKPVAPNSPPLLASLKKRTDHLRFDSLISVSTIEAESFRQSLLRDRESLAHLVAKAAVQFRNGINEDTSPSLQNAAAPDIYDLRRFQLDQDQWVDAIAGRRALPDPKLFYGSFAGKWYGIWDGEQVDHHWGDYVELQEAKNFTVNDQSEVSLMGWQYAWVGDGYGINHVASARDAAANFLLGYVVHIRDQDPEQEVVRRPHVGVIDGPDRLIWITKGEVFFEEMIRGSDDQSDRYYITGFRYRLEPKPNDKPQANSPGPTLIANEAFQVVYSRSAEQRQPWRGFPIDLHVE